MPANARFRDRTSFAKDCRAKEHLRSSAPLERTGPLQPVVRPLCVGSEIPMPPILDKLGAIFFIKIRKDSGITVLGHI